MSKNRKNNPKLGKWLIAFIIGALGIALIIGPGPATDTFYVVNFKTTSSSLIYFKNIRSFYYSINEKDKTPFVLYGYRDWNDRDTDPALEFSIISNPLMDEAYIFSKFNTAYLNYDSLSLYIMGLDGSTQKKKSLKRLNNEDHYLIAATVYSNLFEEKETYLLNGEDTLGTLYPDPRDAELAKIVLGDYFNLVGRHLR